MYPAALLAALEAQGVRLEPVGCSLRAHGELSSEARAIIREHKALLLAYLTLPPLIAAAYERGEAVRFDHDTRAWAVLLPSLMLTLEALASTEDSDNARVILSALKRARAGAEDALDALRAYLERPEVLRDLEAYERARAA